MLSWAPLERRPPWGELGAETEAQRLDRYQEIAAAAIAVAVDPENPPLFAGDEARARARTAALLLAVAYHESSFYNRVTTTAGRDLLPRGGAPGRSDSGRSWCALQILIGRSGAVKPQSYLARHIPEGWTGRDLESDARRCFVVGYRLLRTSFAHCARAPLELRMGAYTGEGCGRAPKSRARIARAMAATLPPLLPAEAPARPQDASLALDER